MKDSPFGPVSDPRIPVIVRGILGVRRLHFLIDTGADFAVAPRIVAEWVGLDWDTLQGAHITGIGQTGVQARLGRLPIQIGDVGLRVRCLFLGSGRNVFILGRADFLDRFVLTIDQPRQRIILEEVTA